MEWIKEYWSIVLIVASVLGIQFIPKFKITPLELLLIITNFILTPVRYLMCYDLIKCENDYKKISKEYKNDSEKLMQLEERHNEDMLDLTMKMNILMESSLADDTDRLLHLCTKYIEDGKISAFQLKSLDMKHKVYKKKGGNSFIDDLYNRVKKLPIEKSKE